MLYSSVVVMIAGNFVSVSWMLIIVQISSKTENWGIFKNVGSNVNNNIDFMFVSCIIHLHVWISDCFHFCSLCEETETKYRTALDQLEGLTDCAASQQWHIAPCMHCVMHRSGYCLSWSENRIQEKTAIWWGQWHGSHSCNQKLQELLYKHKTIVSYSKKHRHSCNIW